ncbi:MAG: hypothetical protein AAF633_10795, partial [Chloroflexota bacterium]
RRLGSRRQGRLTSKRGGRGRRRRGCAWHGMQYSGMRLHAILGRAAVDDAAASHCIAYRAKHILFDASLDRHA